MGRILAIDYGRKRTGIAVTDPLKIIASPLETVPTPELFKWLKAYFQREDVEEIVLGMPTRHDSSDTHVTADVRALEERLKKLFPGKPVALVDERFTSSIASQSLLEGGFSKKKRRDKSLVDKVSASLILQTYLGH